MKKLLKRSKSLAKKGAFVAGTAFVSAKAMAVDTAAIGTAIDAAEADALTTGEMVIGAVAGLVVVGLIIGMVKKI